MLHAIHKETQNPDHESYGMFILVIMAHSNENGSIMGVDGTEVKLHDVYEMLSGSLFLTMLGKPKFVVIQADSGSK